MAIPGVKAAVARVGVGGTVRFEGDPVAAVAAITPEIAEDAMYAIAVEYEVLAACRHGRGCDQTRCGADFSNDKRVIEQHSPCQPERRRRCGGRCVEIGGCGGRSGISHADSASCCLETHVVVVDYSGGDTATVYCSTQGTFSIPGDAAQSTGAGCRATSPASCITWAADLDPRGASAWKGSWPARFPSKSACR